ncbi:MAG: hypothetical protein ABW139_06615 [Candidatus Thiodiazotropha sp. DIVDIV]
MILDIVDIDEIKILLKTGFNVLINKNYLLLYGINDNEMVCSLAKFLQENNLQIRLEIFPDNFYGKNRRHSYMCFNDIKLKLYNRHSGGTHGGDGATIFDSLNDLIKDNHEMCYTDGWNPYASYSSNDKKFHVLYPLSLD